MEFQNQKSIRSIFFIKNQKGLIVFLIPLVSLMIVMLLGFSQVSLAIKNQTESQKHCIIENLSAQKKLKHILNKILSLNEKVKILYHKRQALETALTTAVALGKVKAVPFLKKKIQILDKMQKLLIAKQKYLLSQSEKVKQQSFQSIKRKLKKLRASSVQDETRHKKALALSKKTLSPQAYLYEPAKPFPERQKTVFSWEINLLTPLISNGQPSKGWCVATLERSKKQWQVRLFH